MDSEQMKNIIQKSLESITEPEQEVLTDSDFAEYEAEMFKSMHDTLEHTTLGIQTITEKMSAIMKSLEDLEARFQKMEKTPQAKGIVKGVKSEKFESNETNLNPEAVNNILLKGWRAGEVSSTELRMFEKSHYNVNQLSQETLGYVKKQLGGGR